MLKAADAYIKLGEISLESEQYETAIADIRSCLEIQQELLDPSDRAIAETYLLNIHYFCLYAYIYIYVCTSMHLHMYIYI